VETSRLAGCVGVDLNPWGLAVTRIDRSGNPADHFDSPWMIRGRRQAQIQAEIGDTVRGVVLYAREKGVPIAVERLDFAEAKKAAGTRSANRMLSAFAYAAFARMMRGRCAREGVELIQTCPAFTSVIGEAKFAGGYGLSVHRAAACAIGRRALNFGESLRTRHTGSALPLPARNRRRHVWSDWSSWAKARKRQRRSLPKPKGSRGPQPHVDRGMTSDPPPPNGRTANGRAGGATPRIDAEILDDRGATPRANGRRCCSGGLLFIPPALSQRNI